MNNPHPPVPPQSLVRRVSEEGIFLSETEDPVADDEARDTHIANFFAQWGADRELEAVLEEITHQEWFADPTHRIGQLLNARRPLSSSDKALSELALAVNGGEISSKRGGIIKQAIEDLRSRVLALEGALTSQDTNEKEVATDKQLYEIWHRSELVSEGLRNVYNFGRSHGPRSQDDAIPVCSDTELREIWNKYSGQIIYPLREIYDLGRRAGHRQSEALPK